jgi:hypothetical protein
MKSDLVPSGVTRSSSDRSSVEMVIEVLTFIRREYHQGGIKAILGIVASFAYVAILNNRLKALMVALGCEITFRKARRAHG